MGKTPGHADDQPGAWLRRELSKRGYDLRYGGQSQFARDAGIHVSIVNRVINKGQGVELDVLRRIGRALNYNLGEMLILSGQAERDELPVRPPEGLEDAPPPEPDTNPYTDPIERQLWEVTGLDEGDRHMLVRVFRAVRQNGAVEERPAAEVWQIRRPS